MATAQRLISVVWSGLLFCLMRLRKFRSATVQESKRPLMAVWTVKP
jgi:hypothetical protein